LRFWKGPAFKEVPVAVFKLLSPGKRAALNLFFDGALSYEVLVDGREAAAPAPLGLVTAGGDFSRDLVFKGESRSSLDSSYRIPAFKKAECTDRANCLALVFEKAGAELLVEARAYDDGAAIRLTLKGSGPVQVLREAAAFGLPRSAVDCYVQKHLWSYEDNYHPVTREELWQNVLALPLLARLEGGYWALYAEAGVYGGEYGGSVLRSCRENPALLGLARSPDQLGSVTGNLPFSTPWRAVIAGTLNDIVRSNLLENLNPPPIVQDPSFIKPGKLAWHWMVENDGAGDPKMMRDFVDYAAEMGFPYSLVDAGWPGHTDIPELVRYGREKNVGIWIWEHSSAVRDPAEAEEKFKLWASWGVAGLKIDFFESDSQERIAQYGMLARLGDTYRLMLNFHGCSKPGGTSRLWPHVLSYEGVMGAEYLQTFSTYLPGGPDAAHNCTLPFTRNAVGPMDYTPVIYRSFLTGTTDAHQTALTVVFTSYALHIAERPEIVRSHPCRPFLVQVPAVWDDTLLLEGMPASHVTMARRRGDEWYVAGICARRPRWAEFSFDFLDPRLSYGAELYADDISGDLPFDQALGALPEPDERIIAGLRASFSRSCAHQHDIHRVRTEQFSVKPGEEFRLPLSVNGGFALRVFPR
jgi:alpha-glucosidase